MTWFAAIAAVRLAHFGGLTINIVFVRSPCMLSGCIFFSLLVSCLPATAFILRPHQQSFCA